MTEKDLPALNIADLQSLLRRREVSPREVLDALRARIEDVDGEVDAYLSTNFEAATKEAEKANVDLPLGGVPIAIKDIISVAGEPCTCASKILRGYRALYDATVIQKLRAAGAIPFGKTNMDEFAMGSSTENSGVKLTRNPWDLSRVPGGSSGGSAAAVAADAAFGALGTDTGGSIRQPAALSGIVGFKPSYGRVSRFGLVAFASSLDQAGPLTKTVRDAALIMNAIAGHDPQDSTCLNEPVPDYTAALGRDLRGVRLGLPKEYMIEGIEPQVKSAIDAAIAQFETLGAEIVDVSLPQTDYAIAVYYILATAEASANLARFDGVRYGHNSRHLRFEFRLLRRLLFARAKSPRADPPGFCQGVRESGRIDFADFPGACVQTRRTHGRSVANVSCGYLHQPRESRRNLWNQCAVRLRRDRWPSLACWFAVVRKSL
jgi:aspartyl-tRNA(Asn)/glutamyl-tRNA(Gln) amidotransferase subunit A